MSKDGELETVLTFLEDVPAANITHNFQNMQCMSTAAKYFWGFREMFVLTELQISGGWIARGVIWIWFSPSSSLLNSNLLDTMILVF